MTSRVPRKAGLNNRLKNENERKSTNLNELYDVFADIRKFFN